MIDPKKLLHEVATWARANNIPKPTTKLGMEMLVRKYLEHLQQRAAQVPNLGEVWDEDSSGVHLTSDGGGAQIEDNRPDGNDDFSQMLRDRSAAMAEAEGNDLARDAIMLERGRDQLARVAPFVRNAPPSVLKGSLGGQANCKTGDPFVNVANWIGDDDAESTDVIVTFAPVNQIDTTDVGNAPRRPTGIVQFGTRGFLTTAKVDIGKGTRFTVSGSQVILQVGLDATPGLSPLGSMLLSGMLSFGRVTPIKPPTRSNVFYTGGTAPNAPISATEQFVVVPPFAKSLTLWVADATTTVRIRPLDSSAAILYTWTTTAGAGMFQEMPLSGDAVLVGVTKIAGGDCAGEMIFNLEL